MNDPSYKLPDAEYRVYVASLSDYNAGVLHGAWIDCDGKDADEIQDEVNAILRASKYPNVMVEHGGEQVPSAEEYAIHDREGFGDLVGEYTSINELAAIVEALGGADDPDALKEFADNYGYDIREAAKHFEDAYQGQWDSEKEFAEHMIDACYDIEKTMGDLSYYFDYDAFARDLFMDYTMTPSGYVFCDNH